MTRPPNKRVSRGQPIRRGAPAKKSSGCLTLAVAMVVTGLLMLSPLHYFAPVILLVALPAKEWRAAAC